MTTYKPIEVATALALYGYNISPVVRATKLFDHFQGNCMEINDLFNIMSYSPAWAATELPYPTAVVYVDHALERYGEEAIERCRINAGGP